MNNEQREINRKKCVLEHAEKTGNVIRTCRYFGVASSTFYVWRQAFRERGETGLVHSKPIRRSHPNQTPPEVVEKVLYLRRTHHLGLIRIVWYLTRYHNIKISDAGVYRILRRHGLNRLPGKVGRRAVHTKRYNKQVPGHHIQVDAKFRTFKRKGCSTVRRYQYTAIDDATRIRALKIYQRHNQKNAIDVIDEFPFRIQTIRTHRGHEFQEKFHWYV